MDRPGTVGARVVVISQNSARLLDGNEILRRVGRHGVTLMCAAPAVVNAALDAAGRWEGPIPGRDRVRIVVAGAPPPTRTIEVEDALMSHPSVREVAVIGIPDEKWGEMVTGLVVPDGSGVASEDLIKHSRTLLAGYKCPKRVDFVESVPRTATGKLQKFKLREPFWAGIERKVN